MYFVDGPHRPISITLTFRAPTDSGGQTLTRSPTLETAARRHYVPQSINCGTARNARSHPRAQSRRLWIEQDGLVKLNSRRHPASASRPAFAGFGFPTEVIPTSFHRTMATMKVRPSEVLTDVSPLNLLTSFAFGKRSPACSQSAPTGKRSAHARPFRSPRSTSPSSGLSNIVDGR